MAAPYADMHQHYKLDSWWPDFMIEEGSRKGGRLVPGAVT